MSYVINKAYTPWSTASSNTMKWREPCLDSLNLAPPPGIPGNVHHKLSTVGKCGSDRKPMSNATTTSRMPREAGIGCRILVGDQVATTTNKNMVYSQPLMVCEGQHPSHRPCF